MTAKKVKMRGRKMTRTAVKKTEKRKRRKVVKEKKKQLDAGPKMSHIWSTCKRDYDYFLAVSCFKPLPSRVLLFTCNQPWHLSEAVDLSLLDLKLKNLQTYLCCSRGSFTHLHHLLHIEPFHIQLGHDSYHGVFENRRRWVIFSFWPDLSLSYHCPFYFQSRLARRGCTTMTILVTATDLLVSIVFFLKSHHAQPSPHPLSQSDAGAQ